MPDKLFSFVSFNYGSDRIKHMELLCKSIAALPEKDKDLAEFMIVEKGEKHFDKLRSNLFRYIHIDEDDTYNRSKCLNVGGFASIGKYIIFNDNDVPIINGFFDACTTTTKDFDFFSTYNTLHNLDRDSTENVFNDPQKYNFGYRDTSVCGSRSYNVSGVHGGSICVESNLFKNITGGFDERFIGWGGEDNEFRHRCLFYAKKEGICNQNLIHLHHDQLNQFSNSNYDNNLQILKECYDKYSI